MILVLMALLLELEVELVEVLVLLVLVVVFLVFRRVQRIRLTPRVVATSLARVAPIPLALLFPRVLPRVPIPLAILPMTLLESPLPPLPMSPLAEQVKVLVRPWALVLLPCPPLLVLRVLVLPITWLTLLPGRLELLATATDRLPLAFPLPVDMRMTLPVLTLKAILTRGMLCGVGVTLASLKAFSGPPL